MFIRTVPKDAVLLCRVGLQSRAIYEVNGLVYEQNIDFGDGDTVYYQVSPDRAAELREFAAAVAAAKAAQFACSPEGHRPGSGAMRELNKAVDAYNEAKASCPHEWRTEFIAQGGIPVTDYKVQKCNLCGATRELWDDQELSGIQYSSAVAAHLR